MNEKILKALAEAKTDAERSKVLKDAGFYTEDEFREGLVKAGSGASPELIQRFEEQAKEFAELKKSLVEFQRPPVFGDPDKRGIRDNGIPGSGNMNGAIMRSYRHAGETTVLVDREDEQMKSLAAGFKEAFEKRGHFKADMNVRTYVQRAYSGESNAAGGFLSGPGTFSDSVLEIVYEDSEIWNAAQKVMMGKDSWTGPQLVQTFGSNPSYYGGITATWGRAQSQAMVENTTATYELRELRAQQVYILQKVPMEFIDDTPMFMTHLINLMGRRATFEFDAKFWAGTGNLEPLGFLVDGNVTTVARTTTNRVKIADLTDLDDAIDEAFSANLTYYARKATFGDLPNDVSATEGLPKAQIMIQDLSQALNPGKRGGLNGNLVKITKHAPALGTKGDLTLMDPRSYLIGVRKDWTIETSDQVFWNTNELGVRMIARIDGQPIYPGGIKPLAA